METRESKHAPTSVVVVNEDLDDLFPEDYTHDLLREIRKASINYAAAIQSTKVIKAKNTHYSSLKLRNLLDEKLNLDALQEELKINVKEINSKVYNYSSTVQMEIDSSKQLQKKISIGVDNLKVPLRSRLLTIKQELICAIQKAAVEYKKFLEKHNLWDKKYLNFIDKFGCVAVLVGSEKPYDIDLDRAYGLNFGSKNRLAKKLTLNPPNIEIIKRLGLKDIEKMLNMIIDECNNDTSDNYDALKIFNNELAIFAERHSNIIQMEYQPTWVWSYLDKVRIIKQEPDIIDSQIKINRESFESFRGDQISSLKIFIKSQTEELQESVREFFKYIDKNISNIDEKIDKTVKFLNFRAEKTYEKIEIKNKEFKSIITKAMQSYTTIVDANYRLKINFDKAIEFAKKDDKGNFNLHKSILEKYLNSLKEHRDKIEEYLESLRIQREAINDKITAANENFQAEQHKVFKSTFDVLDKEYLSIKNKYEKITAECDKSQEYLLAAMCYGKFYFKTSVSHSSLDAVEKKRSILDGKSKKLYEIYKSALSDSIEEKFDIETPIQEIKQLARSAHIELKEMIGSYDNYKKYERLAHQTLNEAASGFSDELHAEHVDYFTLLLLKGSDKRELLQPKKELVDGFKKFADALKDYAAVFNGVRLIEEKFKIISESMIRLKAHKSKMSEYADFSFKFINFGIVINKVMKNSDQELAEIQKEQEIIEKEYKAAKKINDENNKEIANLRIKYFADVNKEAYTIPENLFKLAHEKFVPIVEKYKSLGKIYKGVSRSHLNVESNLKQARKNRLYRTRVSRLRYTLLDNILSNLHLWQCGKWGGGLDYAYKGKTYRIPHGVMEIIKALYELPYDVLVTKLKNIAAVRDGYSQTLKYRLFAIRNEETTGKLYKVVKSNLDPDNFSEESMLEAFRQIRGCAVSSFEFKP